MSSKEEEQTKADCDFDASPFLNASNGDEKADNGVGEIEPRMCGVTLATLDPPTDLGVVGKSQLSKPNMALPSKPGLTEKSLQREWSGGMLSSSDAAATNKWNVQTENLEMLPTDFPLERTHREIDCTAEQVASRITQALRRLSIQAEYDCQKCKAKCETADFCRFRIRLYAGDMSGQPVVVEIQRRSGDTRSFLQSCRSILRAAEGKNTAEHQNSTKALTMTLMTKPISQMKCLQSPLSNGLTQIIDCSSAWMRTLELINAEKRDEVVLGLQHLCTMTDPVHTAESTALDVSRKIIMDMNLIGEVYLRCREEEEENNEGNPDDLANKIRVLCLNVLSNSLSLLASKDSLEALEGHALEVLCPLLLDELKESTECVFLHRAHIVSCCWSSLLCNKAAIDHIRTYHGDDCITLLEDAHETGRESHELLEKEAGRSLEKLTSVL